MSLAELPTALSSPPLRGARARVRNPQLAALLALLFVLGQSFAFFHATQHELAGTATTACAICSAAHTPSLGGASLPRLLRVRAQRARRVSLYVPRTTRRAIARPRSRAPPAAFLAS